MSKIKSQVLKDIRDNGIKPTSKFYFVTRNYFFRLLFIVSVVVGAISFAAILQEMIIGSQFYKGTNLFEAPTLFVQSIPFFWLLLLAIFTGSAWFNYKRTDEGERRDNGMIVLASILFSLLFGLLIFRIGLSEDLDIMMKTHLPAYRLTAEQRLERSANYLERKDLNEQAKKALLQRERLRTLCLNYGHQNCFGNNSNSSAEVKENLE